jgi:hypothetical protein
MAATTRRPAAVLHTADDWSLQKSEERLTRQQTEHRLSKETRPDDRHPCAIVVNRHPAQVTTPSARWVT